MTRGYRHAAESGGYRPLHQSGARCPSCWSSGWLVGRKSAECARCGTVLPLAPEEVGRCLQ